MSGLHFRALLAICNSTGSRTPSLDGEARMAWAALDHNIKVHRSSPIHEVQGLVYFDPDSGKFVKPAVVVGPVEIDPRSAALAVLAGNDRTPRLVPGAGAEQLIAALEGLCREADEAVRKGGDGPWGEDLRRQAEVRREALKRWKAIATITAPEETVLFRPGETQDFEECAERVKERLREIIGKRFGLRYDVVSGEGVRATGLTFAFHPCAESLDDCDQCSTSLWLRTGDPFTRDSIPFTPVDDLVCRFVDDMETLDCEGLLSPLARALRQWPYMYVRLCAGYRPSSPDQPTVGYSCGHITMDRGRVVLRPDRSYSKHVSGGAKRATPEGADNDPVVQEAMAQLAAVRATVQAHGEPMGAPEVAPEEPTTAANPG